MKSVLLVLLVMSAAACTSDGADLSAPAQPQFAGNPKPTNPTPTFYVTNEAAYGLRGDNAYVEPGTSAFAGTSRYKHGECGVDNVLYEVASGDAIMGTGSDRKCTSSPRKVRITYSLINPDGSTTPDGTLTSGTFLNVRVLQKAASAGDPAIFIPVGDTQSRTMAFSDDDLICGPAGIGAIVFRPVLQDGQVVGADSVRVFRSAADTWVVFTPPDDVDALTGQIIHHDKAYCRNNGKLYHMPISFTIRTLAPLTP